MERRPFSEEGIEFLHAGPMVDNGARIGLITKGHVYTMWDIVGHPVNMTYDTSGQRIRTWPDDFVFE